MIYLALTSFTDTQDNGYKYHTGDKYPRAGYQPTAERIDELLTDKNRRRTPIIKAETTKKVEKAEEKPAETPADVTEKKEVEKPKTKKSTGRPRKK